jgi:hypothetical protein
MDLKEIIVNFEYETAYHALREIIEIAGIESVEEAVIDIKVQKILNELRKYPSAYDIWIKNAREEGY